VWSDRRITVVFQPHRYSRARDLFKEFTRAFNDADVLLVMEIYPAGEEPIEGITGRAIYEGIREHGHREAYFVPTVEEAVTFLTDFSREGDLILTLGAGDVYRVGDGYLDVVKKDGR